MIGRAKPAGRVGTEEVAAAPAEESPELPTVDMSNVEVPPSLSSPMTHIDVPPRPVQARTTAQSHRRHDFFWGALAVAAALLLGGAIVAMTTYRSEARPAGVVARYFDELTEGNASAALGFGAIPVGDRRLLTASVLRAQNARGRISKFAILTQKSDGTNATVDVQYSVDDGNGAATVTDTIDLVRQRDIWRLKAVAVPVTTQFAGANHRITLLGGAVVLPKSPLLMFPGALPFGFDTPNLRFAKESLVIRFHEPADVGTTAAVEPTQGAIDQIKSVIDEQFKACLNGTATHQVLCPLPTGKRGVPGTLRGESAQPPSSVAQVGVSDDPGGIFEITAAVTVKGSYQSLDFNNIASSAQVNDLVTLKARAIVSTPRDIVWVSS